MRTFRIKQVKDRQDEDELSVPDDTRRSRESPPTIPGGSDERSESSANREAAFMPAGETCNPAHHPGKIPCVQFAALAPNESGLYHRRRISTGKSRGTNRNDTTL